jgi:predicted metal-dependent phosphoesterase TrpH
MPIVADFTRELRRRATPSAAWHKVDLHNHSPASDDFQGDRATALVDFAEAIRTQRLSVVMFTDHERLR